MSNAYVKAAIAIFVVVLLPAAAFAAGDAGKKSVLEPNLVNSIVTVVVFGVLLAVLYQFAWGPILKGLQLREEGQFKAIADAKKAKEEAEALVVQAKAELAKVPDQVRAILEAARADAEKLRESEKEKLKIELEAERERARREIAAEKEAMSKEVQQGAVELATLIASKAIRQQVTIRDQTDLLDASIAELKTNASQA